ncbi:hypothetical protein M231_06213 [Tremella mesenterica]|uniref:Uncharacterized protein n=1 Tax=Tremella mesenterica TaxID=5217 RepID=A0A4Q1BCD3_TREME|nr:hypothetical protein M231_06213 [Tremella mesenterica]
MSTLPPEDPKSIPSSGSNNSALRIETGKDTSRGFRTLSQIRAGFSLNPNHSSSSIPDSPAPVTPDDPPAITLSDYKYLSTKKFPVQDPIDGLGGIEPECTNCAVLPDAGYDADSSDDEEAAIENQQDHDGFDIGSNVKGQTGNYQSDSSNRSPLSLLYLWSHQPPDLCFSPQAIMYSLRDEKPSKEIRSETVYYLRMLRDTMDYLQTALEEDPASQEMPRSHGLTEEQIIEARKDLNVYAAGIATNVLVTYRWYNSDRPPSRQNLRLVIERALTLSRFGPDDGSEAEQQAISWSNSKRAKKERARFWSVIEPFWPHVKVDE